MSDSNSMNRIIPTENLGGMGDTDDLVVVGMVDHDGEGGIGVISSDNGMSRRPRGIDAKASGNQDAAGESSGTPAPKRRETEKRKAVDGSVEDSLARGATKRLVASKAAPKATVAPKTNVKTTHGNGDAPTRGMGILSKVLIAILVIFLGALVGVWMYGRAHYSEHLFPGRRVDGVNVSDMTAKEAMAATSVERWSFVVDDRGSRYELDSDDVGFQTEEIDFAKIIADQDVNLWFLHVIAPDTNEAIRKSTYDRNAVHESVMALPCISEERDQPVDASVKRAENGTSYEIVPEEEGNVVKAEVIEAAVEKALSEGQNGAIDLEKSDAYVHPLVYANDESIVSAVDTANKWMRTSITYDIDGLESVETLGPETISQWVDIVRDEPEEKPDNEDDDQSDEHGEEGEDKDEETKDQKDDQGDGSAVQVFGRVAPDDGGGMFYQVSETVLDDGIRADTKNDSRPKPTFRATFNDDGLRGWLSGIGDEYDTVGKPKTITTPNGDVKEVSGGGSYGWITDEASEFDAIKASMESGETVHREFAMKQRAALPKGQNEWGNTYIEIDLSAQHLWYIRNGEVILSYGVITGKSGYETPAMVSQVYSKVTDIVLISPWKDPKTGEPTYKTHIDVGLVISGDGGILCHDAPWQPNSGFGKPGYHWSGGSHGCCNMRTSDCWELYNTASVGDPVVVHY